MTEEQLSAGATPRQAELLFIGDLVALCKMTNDKLHTATIDPLHLYIHARDLAYFKLHLFSGDRPSDLAQIKAAESLRFPNDKGILFDHVLGKTLRSGDSRVFAVARHPNSAICPVQALDDYSPTRPSIKISLHSGPLLLLLAAALFFLMFSPQMLPKLGSRATWKLPDSPTRSFTVFAAVEPLPWHLLEALWTTLWNIWAGNLIAWLGITCNPTNRSYLKALRHKWPRLHQTHPPAMRQSINFEVSNLLSPRIYPVWLPHRYASHPKKCSMEHLI